MPISSYEDMKEKKGKIVHSLIEVAEVVDELNEIGLNINGSALLDLKKRVEDDDFKVLVIGEFKNGKSTFINSMMGSKVLPAYSTPCTAVINEVKYGEMESATLYFKNPLPDEISSDISIKAKQHIEKYAGKTIPPIELDVDELEEYVVIPDPTKDQADSIQELPYDKAVLKYPIELCHDGITIIDSPGLNESGTRTKVTEEYLKQADAILFVFRCPKIAGESEMNYITDQIHARGYRDIFFICNAINQVPDDEQDRLIKFGNKKLLPLTDLGEKGIFYVDALGALKARMKKDKSALADTGMVEFENALSEYLRENKGRAKLMQVIKPGIEYIDIKLRKEYIENYINALDRGVDECEEKIKAAMPNLDKARQRKRDIVSKIALSMRELEDDIRLSMDDEFDNVINRITKAVDDMKLENSMTVNPFKQKSKKEALEKEVVSNLEQFVQKEMAVWSRDKLKVLVDRHINTLEKEIGRNIDEFYDYLDEFRYVVSGVEKPKNISGLSRVSATILGTVVGGPVYGAVGASLGFGEIIKRSAITMGLSFAGGAILALTPIGLAAITTAATIALFGAGILQLATGGKDLTVKYKNKLKESFINSLKEDRERSCKDYANTVTNDVREKFKYIEQVLDGEIEQIIGYIAVLDRDKNDSKEDREVKVIKLKECEGKLLDIRNTLKNIGNSLD